MHAFLLELLFESFLRMNGWVSVVQIDVGHVQQQLYIKAYAFVLRLPL
jgi:hypothetical protein